MVGPSLPALQVPISRQARPGGLGIGWSSPDARSSRAEARIELLAVISARRRFPTAERCQEAREVLAVSYRPNGTRIQAVRRHDHTNRSCRVDGTAPRVRGGRRTGALSGAGRARHQGWPAARGRWPRPGGIILRVWRPTPHQGSEPTTKSRTATPSAILAPCSASSLWRETMAPAGVGCAAAGHEAHRPAPRRWRTARSRRRRRGSALPFAGVGHRGAPGRRPTGARRHPGGRRRSGARPWIGRRGAGRGCRCREADPAPPWPGPGSPAEVP